MLGLASMACSAEDDVLGTAELEVQGTSSEVVLDVSPDGLRDPSVAWLGSQSVMGHMLVAWEHTARGAAWSHSDTYFSSTPAWQTKRYWNDADVPWAEPDNFCDLYICPDDVIRNYEAAHAIWPGVRSQFGSPDHDVAAIVSAMRVDPVGTIDDWVDLVVHSSRRAGKVVFQSGQYVGGFSKGHILSGVTAANLDSGTAVVPDSIHVALGQTPALFSEEAGNWSQPVYVVWQNFINERQWWMTKFVVGVDGEIAELAEPRLLTGAPIPREVEKGRVAISAFTENDGTEVTELVWSDVVGNTNLDCPGATSAHVQWWRAFTRDFGSSWSTPELIDEDREWKPCVAGGGLGTGENNHRPEIVPHQGHDHWNGVSWDELAPWSFYVAINKNIGGVQKIVLERYVSGSWSTVFTSTNTRGDAWKQSLAVHVGKYQSSPPGSTSALVALMWREFDGDRIRTRAATGGPSFTPFLTEADLSAAGTALVPAGLHTGLAVQQNCLFVLGDGGSCIVATQWPSYSLVGAWIQGSERGESELRARAFTH